MHLCGVIPGAAGIPVAMGELVGETYGDDHAEEEAAEQKPRGTQPGEGKNDAPATTGTHRGWGDPQPEADEAD